MADTEDPFDTLLNWLDPDRNKAAEKYETIRAGLIRVFVSKGFSDAEDLADETINRVMARLPDIGDGYVGEKANYFHGVARNVMREAKRRKEFATDVFPIPAITAPPDFSTGILFASNEYNCLIKCLAFVPPAKRELILDYYVYQGRAKIENHQTLARELSVSKGALRTRAHHLRSSLEGCVLDCVEKLVIKERKAAAKPYLGG